MDAIADGLRALRLSVLRVAAQAIGHDADGHCRIRAATRRLWAPSRCGSDAMFRKILIGLALVAMLCAVGASGYQFGKYLRERDRAADVRPG